MTGAEHYAEAEQRVTASDYHWQNNTHDVMTALGAVREAAVAQVHATLALAAATEKATAYAHNIDTSGYGR